MNVKFKYVLKYYPIFQLQTEKNPITSKIISVYLKHKVYRTVVPPLKIDIDQWFKLSDAKDAQMG